MKKGGILDRLLSYELETNVEFDAKNTAINMAVIVVFIIIAALGVRYVWKGK